MYVSENGNRELGKFRHGASTGRLGEVYTAPGEAILTTQADSRDTYLVQQMHALATSIYQAKQRNDKETVEALLIRFRALADEYRERGPIGVNAFDKFIIETGEWIKKVPGAITDVSLFALKGLWPFAVAGLGLLYLKSKL